MFPTFADPVDYQRETVGQRRARKANEAPASTRSRRGSNSAASASSKIASSAASTSTTIHSPKSPTSGGGFFKRRNKKRLSKDSTTTITSVLEIIGSERGDNDDDGSSIRSERPSTAQSQATTATPRPPSTASTMLTQDRLPIERPESTIAGSVRSQSPPASPRASTSTFATIILPEPYPARPISPQIPVARQISKPLSFWQSAKRKPAGLAAVNAARQAQLQQQPQPQQPTPPRQEVEKEQEKEIRIEIKQDPPSLRKQALQIAPPSPSVNIHSIHPPTPPPQTALPAPPTDHPPLPSHFKYPPTPLSRQPSNENHSRQQDKGDENTYQPELRGDGDDWSSTLPGLFPEPKLKKKKKPRPTAMSPPPPIPLPSPPPSAAALPPPPLPASASASAGPSTREPSPLPIQRSTSPDSTVLSEASTNRASSVFSAKRASQMTVSSSTGDLDSQPAGSTYGGVSAVPSRNGSVARHHNEHHYAGNGHYSGNNHYVGNDHGRHYVGNKPKPLLVPPPLSPVVPSPLTSPVSVSALSGSISPISISHTNNSHRHSHLTNTSNHSSNSNNKNNDRLVSRLSSDSFTPVLSPASSTYSQQPLPPPSSSQPMSPPPPASSPSSATSFLRALTKMERAGPKVIAARLAEEWEDCEDEEEAAELRFEKRLWALTAYQWLTQGKQLLSPTHEILAGARREEGRRVLHVHGSVVDGWVLAARYPNTTVYTVSSSKSTITPPSYTAPLNHHNIFVPLSSSPMPFPDAHFDAVVARSLPRVLSKYEWIALFLECARVLKPGGRIEVHSLDPHLARQGPRLKAWVDECVARRLEAAGKLEGPSAAALNALAMAGLVGVKRARIALPAVVGAEGPASPTGDVGGDGVVGDGEAAPAGGSGQMRVVGELGRHLYRDAYSGLIREERGEEWFWGVPELVEECAKLRSQMVLTVACACKPGVGGGVGVEGIAE